MDEMLERLRRVLEAAATAPGNRDRFLAAGLLETATNQKPEQLSPNWQQAFKKLAPIAKQTIRDRPGLFVANLKDIVYRGASSGSRGQSFIYFAGTEWNKARKQARRQSLQWWGIGDNTPIINVASRLSPVREVDLAIAGQPDREFIHLLLTLLTQRPIALRGYPSRLCEVATQLPTGSIPPVLAVICTGENLFDYQCRLLEDVFQASVIEEYGCQETGISGLTCPEVGRLHLDSERCLYEIMDGQLVTTDLLNLAMPIVRYKSGDLLDLHTDACPCGRPGLTGKIRGRIEDGIRTIEGIKYPGDITMPPLNGILTYQVVRREGKNVDVLLQPVKTDELSLEAIATWMQQTFGEVEAQIFLYDTEPINPASLPLGDDTDWIDSISHSSWTDWLREPWLPKGEAKKAAQLLKQLVNPTVIVSSGIPPTTQALLQDILDSPPCKNPEVEQITARVLLLAVAILLCAQVTPTALASLQATQSVQSIYTLAVERRRRAAAQLGKMDETAVVDLLIPSLFLDTNTAKSIWSDSPLPIQGSLDTFNIQNLLYAFEPAWRRALVSGSKPFVRASGLILAVLMGDLDFFASRFGTWLLAYWCELIHGQSVAQDNTPEAPKEDKFLTAWLAWRRQLLKGEENIDSAFWALEEAAESPEEQARVYLEKGYGQLVAGQPLNPEEWLTILDTQAGLIGQGLPKNDVDPVPWIPILRSLIQPLLELKKPELAYQCLVASAVPSSRTSAFERLAFRVNDKQSMIFDRFNGSNNPTNNHAHS